MSDPISRINAYRAAVVATIGAAMPSLKSCDVQFGRFSLDDLEDSTIRTPGVRFGVLSGTVTNAADNIDGKVSCALFVITEGSNREDEAWTIAEAVAVLLKPNQLFGIHRMSAPTGVKITPVVSAPMRRRGVAVIAVEWSQDLRDLGDTIFDDAGHLLKELYVNDELIDLEEGADNV